MQICVQKEDIWAHSFDILLCKTACPFCNCEAEKYRSLQRSLLTPSLGLSVSVFQTLSLWSCDVKLYTRQSPLFRTFLKMVGSLVLLWGRTMSPKLRSLYSTYTIANSVLLPAFLYPKVATQMNVFFNFLGHSKIAFHDFGVVISIP